MLFPIIWSCYTRVRKHYPFYHQCCHTFRNCFLPKSGIYVIYIYFVLQAKMMILSRGGEVDPSPNISRQFWQWQWAYFHWFGPLGRVSHIVAMSVCLCVCVCLWVWAIAKHPLNEDEKKFPAKCISLILACDDILLVFTFNFHFSTH